VNREQSGHPRERSTRLSLSFTKSMRVPTTCMSALLSTRILTPPGAVTSSSSFPFSSVEKQGPPREPWVARRRGCWQGAKKQPAPA